MTKSIQEICHLANEITKTYDFHCYDKIEALWFYANENYNGQGSEMYEFLCRLGAVYSPGKFQTAPRGNSLFIYEQL